MITTVAGTAETGGWQIAAEHSWYYGTRGFHGAPLGNLCFPAALDRSDHASTGGIGGPLITTRVIREAIGKGRIKDDELLSAALR